MTAILDKVEQEALNLPREERAFLADRLLSSLGGEVLTEVDTAWVIEAERRSAEYQAGTRQPIPASKVFAEAAAVAVAGESWASWPPPLAEAAATEPMDE